MSRQERIANAVYGTLVAEVKAWETFKLPVMSTGRNFEFYRKVLFEGVEGNELLSSLKGKRILDIGCGHTPFLSDSMFQTCEAAGDIEFYGIDPKLDGDLRDDLYNRALKWVTGARGEYDMDAPGTAERAIAGYASDLPFDDGSVDVILSSFLMFIWLHDPAVLAEIMTEFDRVLKPGGEIRLYPQPSQASLEKRFPDVMARLAGYDIRQVFHSSLNLTSPPAMLTVYTKPS